MRPPSKIKGGDDERARARLLAYFEDNPETVFYSRQLEVLFENEFFHWITNRALNRLVQEGRILSERRQLSIGSSIKLLWHRKFRFYRRAAKDVFSLVDLYSKSASDGALGIQGEAMVLKAFARQQFVLKGEAVNSFGGKQWTETEHDLDYIFERDGKLYGIEVKNTLGYIEFYEFMTKIRICLHLGIRPVFAVRALPRTWINALVKCGGYAMVMRYQFYPWVQRDIAKEINEKLRLPVDAPRRIADGTMERFEKWVAAPEDHPVDVTGGEAALRKIQAAIERGGARYAEGLADDPLVDDVKDDFDRQ